MNYILQRKKLIASILIIVAPAILEMALNTMLMIADTVMIGQMIGTDAISGVGIVNSFFFLLIFVFSSFNTGAIALISRSYGEKNIAKAEKIAGINLGLNLVIGAVISVMTFFARDFVFVLYDITDSVLASAKDYYSIIVIGMIFQFGSFAFASISRGVENTKTPMYITGFVNIFNIVFNYLLIKGVWIFPELGIQGAAWATTMARVIAFFIYLYIFMRGKHLIRIRWKNIRFTKNITKNLWSISFPGALEQFLMQGAFFILGIFITMLNTTSEALFRVLITIESTCFMPAVGISIATATLVGKSMGEKNIDKATDTGYIATGMGILWGIIAGIAFLLFPRFLLSLFTDDQSLINTGTSVMVLLGVNQIFLNSYIVMSGALRGAGDTRAVMVITSLRLWTVFIPLSYILIRWTDFAVTSVWIAEILSFILYLAILFKRFSSKKWSQLNFETVEAGS